LGLRRPGIPPGLSLLMSASSLVNTPPLVTLRLQRIYNAPLPLNLVETRLNPKLRYTAYRQSFSAQNHSMSQFSEIRFGFRITTLVLPESLGTRELSLACSSLFLDHCRRKNFLAAILLQSDFLELWFGFQITAFVIPYLVSFRELALAFPQPFHDNSRCKSFLTPS